MASEATIHHSIDGNAALSHYQFAFIKLLRSSQLLRYVRGLDPLPAEGQQILEETLGDRVERLVETATTAQVRHALLLQAAPPCDILDYFRALSFFFFIHAGLLVYGKDRFCEMIFRGNDRNVRAIFSRALLILIASNPDQLGKA